MGSSVLFLDNILLDHLSVLVNFVRSGFRRGVHCSGIQSIGKDYILEGEVVLMSYNKIEEV